MRTPSGEIVGVVEILNKRRRNFTKEDEEFLAEVGTHAALAVESVREHEAAVRQARREGAAAVFKSVTPLLLPAAWPETPGFDSAPLRWRSEEPNVALYAVSSAAGRLVDAAARGRRRDRRRDRPARARLRDRAQAPRWLARPSRSCSRSRRPSPAAPPPPRVWDGDRLRICARQAPVPYLLRFGRPVPFELVDSGGVQAVALETAKGDVLVMTSSGLSALQSAGKPASPEKAIQRLARAAETQPLSGAFANLVSEWKKTGVAPGATRRPAARGEAGV